MIEAIAKEIRDFVTSMSIEELRKNKIFRAKLRQVVRLIHGPLANEWMILAPILRGK